MSKRAAGPIQEIGGRVEQFAGPKVRAQVMAGADKAGKSADAAEIALWVNGAMDRLDKLVAPDTGHQIMAACGHTCITMNSGVVTRGQARRGKYPTEDAFLAAEVKKPSKGTRLELNGRVLTQYYTPHSFGRGMRCYCSLMRGLPGDVNASKTYCHCSRGFVEKYWEAVLGRAVRVELGNTAISGARECQFTIHL